MNEILNQTAEIQQVEDSESGPRPVFRLSRFDMWPSAAHCRPTSPSRYSMTTRPIWFRFEAKGSGWSTVLWSASVNFGPQSKSYCSRQLETSAEVTTRVPHVPRPHFELSRLNVAKSGVVKTRNVTVRNGNVTRNYP
jgi:hypothetical protein